ncbi:response regulator transcription factor [Geodermatophilus sp. SYSU D01176]
MRVVIGEDEALLRTGLTHVMQAAGFDVVAAVGNAHELVSCAEEHVPDIVVTDIRMPPDHKDAGLRAAVAIRQEHPGIAVLVLSQHLQRAYAVELLGDRSSGVGYLLKQRIADIDRFTDDLRRIAAGGTVLDPEVVSLMVARARGHHDALDRLTPRQQQVLALMSEGRTNASIARTLSITERAVVQHTSHIYDELGLALSDDDHRRVLAVIRYLSS